MALALALAPAPAEDFWCLAGPAPAGLPEVRVTFLEDADTPPDFPGGRSWFIKFRFLGPGFSAGFLVEDPDLHSFDDWVRLARGQRGLYCSRGSIDVEGGLVIFNVHSCGTSCDLSSAIAVPAASVGPKLLDALTAALAEGLPFAHPSLLPGALDSP